MNNYKSTILKELGVLPTESFDPINEIERRVNHLKKMLVKSGQKYLILGISGGVDSTTAGLLCQRAVDELNSDADKGYKFVAVRLPAGEQSDIQDAILACEVIKPSIVTELNINDAAVTTFITANDNIEIVREVQSVAIGDETKTENDLTELEINKLQNLFDFTLGNVKSRTRMVVQYAISGMLGGLVVGTDHNAEAVTGFFTKYGDGGVDILCLDGLNKRQVRILAEHLGAPETLINKAPTADLENQRPGLEDENALGVTYDEIDDFLEGKWVSASSEYIIVNHWLKTRHKRTMPIGVNG